MADTHKSFAIIENLVKLEVFNRLSSPPASLPSLTVKVLWNLLLRHSFFIDTMLPFTEAELEVLLQARDYEGQPIPAYMYILLTEFDLSYFRTDYRRGRMAAFDFQFYLVDLICYLQETHFSGKALSPETLDWFSEPVPYQDASGQVMVPRVAMALAMGDPQLRETLAANARGGCALLGWFVQWRAHRLIGYHHPQWLLDYLDAPCPEVEHSADEGFSTVVFCVWQAEPGLHHWDLAKRDDRRQLVDWFWSIRSREIPGYSHPDWVCRIKGQAPAAPADGALPGVNLVGWPRVPNGIGEDARVAADALLSAGIPFIMLNAATRQPPGPAEADLGYEDAIRDTPEYRVDLVFLDAATQYRYYAHDLLSGRPLDRKRIVIAPWELPRWPREVAFVLDTVDVFWAATRYIRDAFAPLLPPDRIRLAPPAVVVPPEQLDDFDLTRTDGPLVFLTIFDGLSSIYRKNPLAVIQAFKMAFEPGRQDVRLIVKMMNIDDMAPQVRALHQAIGQDPRVECINRTMTRAQLYELIRRSHCFVSLHRSEGFGRNIAEAMLFNRPCICSAFSGNLDFCNETTAYLVQGRQIPVDSDQYSFSCGQRWFDASPKQAADQMRRVYEDRTTAALIAATGRERIRTMHGVEQTGLRYAALLRELL